ncbi:MAG: histidinol-phosphate aminotransferase family protein [Clostridia bacterium]|nr:histidinol-phosphate aminotransferase family protein [Clostridia bacterium]
MKHGGNVWEGNTPAQWLDFSANLRPEGTPSWVMDAMQKALLNVRYYPEPSMLHARKGLAAYAGVPEACILPTAGGAAAIDLVLQRARGTVYTEQFTFSEYAQRAAVYGRAHRIWHGACRNGDTVFLANPNNPTGASMTPDEVLELHRRVCAQGGELIVDEAFIDFCPERSVRSRVQVGLTVVGSLTKALCIPGVRLGYVCAVPEVIAELEQRSLPWALGALATEIAAQLPEHMQELTEDAQRNAQRRKAFAAQLAGLGAEVCPSMSNFLLVDFHRDMTNAVQHLRAHGILVRTCTSFGMPENVLRLAVKTEAENERLIHELEAVLHAR